MAEGTGTGEAGAASAGPPARKPRKSGRVGPETPGFRERDAERDRARRLVRKLTSGALETGEPNSGLAYVSRFLPGGRAGLVELARLSEDQRVRAVVEEWDKLAGGKHKSPHVKLETLCEGHGILPREFLGQIVIAAYDYNTDISRLLRNVAQPRVLQASIRNAIRQSGFKDREMLLQSTGLVPSHKGISINTTAIAGAKASANEDPNAAGLPSFSETMHAVVEATREQE